MNIQNLMFNIKRFFKKSEKADHLTPIQRRVVDILNSSTLLSSSFNAFRVMQIHEGANKGKLILNLRFNSDLIKGNKNRNVIRQELYVKFDSMLNTTLMDVRAFDYILAPVAYTKGM